MKLQPPTPTSKVKAPVDETVIEDSKPKVISNYPVRLAKARTELPDGTIVEDF